MEVADTEMLFSLRSFGGKDEALQAKCDGVREID